MYLWHLWHECRYKLPPMYYFWLVSSSRACGRDREYGRYWPDRSCTAYDMGTFANIRTMRTEIVYLRELSLTRFIENGATFNCYTGREC